MIANKIANGIRGVLDTTLCDKVCQWLETRGVLDTTLCDKVCQWLETGILVSSTNKTEILLKVALSTINLNQTLIANKIANEIGHKLL